MILVLMDVRGGIDRDDELAEEELPAPGAEHALPVVPVRGLGCERVVVLGAGSTEKVSRLPVIGYVLRRFATPLFGKPPLERAPGAVHEALTVREFCRAHPHPGGFGARAECRAVDERPEYEALEQGAEVCAFCRDRLAVWTTLLAAPAVRAVPAG